jgi:hypothetical protein
MRKPHAVPAAADLHPRFEPIGNFRSAAALRSAALACHALYVIVEGLSIARRSEGRIASWRMLPTWFRR